MRKIVFINHRYSCDDVEKILVTCWEHEAKQAQASGGYRLIGHVRIGDRDQFYLVQTQKNKSVTVFSIFSTTMMVTDLKKVSDYEKANILLQTGWKLISIENIYSSKDDWYDQFVLGKIVSTETILSENKTQTAEIADLKIRIEALERLTIKNPPSVSPAPNLLGD